MNGGVAREHAVADTSAPGSGIATQRLVVVSGLPASGKSTLAMRLGAELRMPVIDKDSILETLFDRSPAMDSDLRNILSRESDDLLRQQAAQLRDAILVSWWRHPASTDRSGTDIGFLQEARSAIVEVHVKCSPELAAARFIQRQRHPGHLDSRRDGHMLHESFARQASLGPLGLGQCIEATSDAEQDLVELCAQIRAALPCTRCAT